MEKSTLIDVNKSRLSSLEKVTARFVPKHRRDSARPCWPSRVGGPAADDNARRLHYRKSHHPSGALEKGWL
jgi:hypothetical protein